MQRLLPLIALAALLLAAPGCSPFDQAWNSYKPPAPGNGPGSGPAGDVQADLAGRWKGNWRSNVNGHNGALRAIITPDDGEHRFTAWYQATYAGLLKFDYKTPLAVQPHEDHYHATGSADLGPLHGGQYDYTLYTDGEAFEATYESDKDAGVYHMRRIR